MEGGTTFRAPRCCLHLTYYVSDALEMEEDKMEIAVALPVISLRSFSPRRPRAAWLWTRLRPRVHVHHTLAPHTETPV
jgi:hypothetical protein